MPRYLLNALQVLSPLLLVGVQLHPQTTQLLPERPHQLLLLLQTGTCGLQPLLKNTSLLL